VANWVASVDSDVKAEKYSTLKINGLIKNYMKEKIENIAKSIHRHRELEIAISATNNAVGRSNVIYNKQEQQIWLINT
jgi:phage gp46-like protein